MADLRERLAAHFPPDDIEWRIGQAGRKDDGSLWAKAFAYITNRAIQQRLDDVVGPSNWKNEVQIHQLADQDGKPVTAFLCGLSLRDGPGEEWVTKWDGAEPTDMEPVKGGLSGSMKRAAVQWGIGRYLYDLPEGWAKVSDKGRHFGTVGIKVKGQKEKEFVAIRWDPPDLPKWALPQVSENGNGEGEHQQSRKVTPEAVERTESPSVRPGPYAPSEKQVAFFTRLMESSVFTEEERRRAMTWLAEKGTRQTCKDQIDWAQRTIAQRKAEATPE
jgi:hypothetical protein